MNKLVYYAGLYTASAGFLKLVGFLLFLWLARTLSVDNYGNFGLLYALQTGLTTFGLVGIVEAVVGLLKEHQSKELRRKLFAAANSAFLITLASSIVLALILFAMFFGGSEISIFTLACILVSGALLAYSMLQSQIVRLEEKHLSSLCFNFVLPLAGLIGSCIGFFWGRTIQTFFLGSILGLSFASVILWINRIGFYGFADRLVETRDILLRVIPFIAIAFFGWLGGYGNNYVIKIFFDPKEVAKYTFALSLSSIMQLIATALNQVWSPRFFRLIHEIPREQVEKKNRRFFRLQSLTMGFFGGIVISMFPFTMNVLGGNLKSYQFMSLELLCLFSAYIILCPWWHCSNYFLAYDKGPSMMRIVFISSVIGIILWLILMWLMGPIGIYIGFLTQMLLRTSGILYKAKKQWPIKVSWDGVVGGLLLTFIGFVASKIL